MASAGGGAVGCSGTWQQDFQTRHPHGRLHSRPLAHRFLALHASFFPAVASPKARASSPSTPGGGVGGISKENSLVLSDGRPQRLCRVLLCRFPLCRVPLRRVPLCRVPLCRMRDPRRRVARAFGLPLFLDPPSANIPPGPYDRSS